MHVKMYVMKCPLFRLKPFVTEKGPFVTENSILPAEYDSLKTGIPLL
jgi:hypothetical protein